MPIMLAALNAAPLVDLRPTQAAIGLREVETKRKTWRERLAKDGPSFLARHVIPVVQARKKRFFMVDHHHLARALLDEGVKEVMISVVGDLRAVDKDSFWTVMDLNKWCRPYNENGDRINFKDIPTSLDKLADDPFRSLAGALRRAGGFAKDTTNYSEFLWADFLRRHIKRKTVVEHFDDALDEAGTLANSTLAAYLPGWCGRR